MSQAATSYRDFLKTAIEARCARNRNYSLRAFAQAVGISPSHLSRVLNGLKELSPESASRIAAELDLSGSETEHFLDLVSLRTAGAHTKKLLLDRIQNRESAGAKKTLEMEAFRVIADWYHLALFELTKAKKFKSDPLWMAGKLGISVTEVKAALVRLEALEMIRVREDGRVEPLEGFDVQTSDDVASIAIKKHHEQMLQKTAEAVRAQSVLERELQGVNFAFDPRKTKEAKKMIREFAERFEEKFKPGGGEDVYHLGVQFFRLTRKEKTEGTL
jgi:uncharacterized protein (TIGR02147 family)